MRNNNYDTRIHNVLENDHVVPKEKEEAETRILNNRADKTGKNSSKRVC